MSNRGMSTKIRSCFVRWCALSILLLLYPICLCAQTGPPPDFDAYIARVLSTFDVPGLAVAIVKDGKVALVKGYGVRKLGVSTPVDDHTLFAIGSNTKAFTAAALATLVDDGKIAWDDRVWERMPGFRMYDPYVSEEMTIRDLLTHRSGLGLGEGDLLFWPHTTFTRNEIVYRLRFMKPVSSFRSRFAYSNLMYIAAGQVILAVTGKSWEDYVRERIFTPLGMTTSNLNNTDWASGADYAWPHIRLDGKLQAIGFVSEESWAPAGSINSSAAEMAKWVLLQLNHGKFPDREGHLFSEQCAAEMWSPQTIAPARNPPFMPAATAKPNFAAYGLGWGLRDYRGHMQIGHSGAVAGFVSRVQMVPDERLGVVILTNAEEEGALDSIAYHVIDYYLNLPLTDWIKIIKAAKADEERHAADAMKQQTASRAANSTPSLPLAEYAGTYKDSWYGSSTIKMDNGKLTFTLDHTSEATGDLEHWQYDTFKIHWRVPSIEDAFVTFALKADGTIDHFTMLPVSPLADFSFDYQDLYFTPVAGAGHKK